MPEIFKTFFTANEFIPHGHCYLWKPELVWLHVVSDSLIALAYYSIPILLVYFVRKRRDVPFNWIFLMFGTFIVACGTTHLLAVWTLWHPTYWLSGLIKAVTALASVGTAVMLVILIPQALALPSPAQLAATNLELRDEITQRQQIEEALQKVNEDLEIRVRSRTAELVLINESLQAEIAERQRVEEFLQRINEELELRVEERTAELVQTNEQFLSEIVERHCVEVALRESEEKFRRIFNDAPIGIALARASDTQFLMVNPAFCNLLGYTESELLAYCCPVISYFEDLEKEQPYAELMFQGKCNGYQMEKRYVKKSGEIFWGSLTTTAIRNPNGEVAYIFGMVEDITERKQAQEALRRTHDELEIRVQERTVELAKVNASLQAEIAERKRAEEELQKSYSLLQNVIEGTPDAIFVKDCQGRYIMLNSPSTNIIGKPKEEILNRDDHDLFSPEIASVLMETDHHIMTTGDAQILEELVPSGGTWRTYLSAKSVWQDSQGNVIGLIGVAKDITDRKRAEQQIKELNENLERRVIERTAELEAANRELEAFSYSVSHDLRAPLRGIDGFSQALLERYADKLDDKGKHYLQRIRIGTQRMGELIDDLLMLSRVTRSEMHRTQVDLSALAQEVAAELQQTQPERSVEWAIAPGLVAYGDARLLRVVLENLLNNSWKFTSIRIHTHIEFGITLQSDTKASYFVRDNGAGFDMAYANKLFGAFQRLHSTTQFPGTGIGLATVQRIIHRHGGRVWAEGVVEQGATFYFTL